MIRILDLLIARTFLRMFALFIVGAPLLFVVGNIVFQKSSGECFRNPRARRDP